MVAVLPDVTGAVRDFLLADTDVAASVVDRVFLTLPDPFVLPAVRVQRVGGVMSAGSNAVELFGPDTADFSVHCWATTVHAADRLAATVRAVLATLPGETSGAVRVAAVRERGAPQVLWDTSRTPALPRVVCTFAVTYR